ncbi:MAG TPA: catalase [Candidatus Binatia bacterium]|nr:catalase [Candidatus Binatia bacterium]
MATRKTRSTKTSKPGKASASADAAALPTSARSTVSGPAVDDAGTSKDKAVQKARGQQMLAESMPANRNKPSEYGDASLMPPTGIAVEPPTAAATGSTLTETQQSAKTGDGEPDLGYNPTNGPLDRVRVDSTGQALTTNQGVPIATNQHSLKAGLRGPALLEDFILREKITHFDHERIPERIVHARGSGAHGFFECYKSLKEVTRASIFAEDGKITPVFVRFSTVAGERGSTDTARDVRGFAVKFYTDEGVWDLVGNNIPVFFIQDAMKFPDLVHAAKPEPHHQMPQASTAHDTFWDFIGLMPESAHMIMWVMSDRAIPRSYRMMQGFGVHTFRFVNEDGDSQFVKFHWSPVAGTHSLVWDEAVKISGADPDFHRRDLWEAIEAGEFPEYELSVQIFTEEQAAGFSFDVLDPTKIVPEELVPLTPIGRMVLDRNPDNFFAETEQVAFCAAHIVPGLDFSNDPLLAGRIHSYVDTQITRLGGPNFHEIPINASVAPAHNNQRDGFHRQQINRGRVNYEPNSLGGGCPFQAGPAGFSSFPQPTDGDKVRGNPELFADHYTQATLFYESQTDIEKAHILRALRFELTRVQVPAVRERIVSMVLNISQGLGEALAASLGMKQVPAPLPKALQKEVEPEVEQSSALSLFARPGDGTIRTRRIAILVADGVDAAAATACHTALAAEGAVPRYIGPMLGTVTGADGTTIEVEVSLEAMPSALFDAVVFPGGEAAAAGLANLGHAAEFLKDQFRHCKAMLFVGEADALIAKAGLPTSLPSGEADPGLLMAPDAAAEEAIEAFIAAVARHRHFERELDPPPL